MEEAILLIGIALLAIPMAFIWLVVSHIRLKRDVQDLRATVAALQHQTLADSPPSDPILPPNADNVVPIGRADPKTTEPAQSAPTPIATRAPVWDRPRVEIPPKSAREPVVFSKARLTRLSIWLRENWFYAVAAVSLALSGIFLVQYGIETGLLSPAARVASALAFGALLIGAGEFIRRRFGDSEQSSTAYLPSVLSGAGLVTLMGGVLSARMLYDMIDPGTALMALFVIALGAMILGWFYGALLAAIGLIGGIAAPFLVGGQSDRPEWLFAYFAFMVALGLGIDTVRRWAWISALALICGTCAGVLLWLGAINDDTLAAGLAGYASVLVVLSVLIPSRSLMPDHQGRTTVHAFVGSILRDKTNVWPIFPARLSIVMTLAACGILGVTAAASAGNFWLNLTLISGLTLLFTFWSRTAPALQDHTLFPALTLLALLGLPGINGPVQQALTDVLAAQDGQTETRMPWTITWLLFAAILPSIFAAWHSLKNGPFATAWAGGAVLLAPLAGLTLELSWQPTTTIGAWPWAFHALALAALMTAMATRFAATDNTDNTGKIRTSMAVISALASLAFAVSVVLFDAALTLALAATVVAAAALDRRFNLSLMGLYISAGIVALGIRLVFDPGLDWGFDAPLMQMLAAYGGTLVALCISYWLLMPMVRPRSKVFVESAIWSVGGMTASLTLHRLINALLGSQDLAELGLHATIWIGLILTQLMRIEMGGKLRWMRIFLAGVYSLFAFGSLAIALSLANPLLSGEFIAGPPLFNTLIPAYLLPALALFAVALRVQPARHILRPIFGILAIATLAVWGGLTIRHAWRGEALMTLQNGVTQPELYSYTVALLLIGALLFYQALARQSDLLRRAGVAMIALAVAKVFLIDISGLNGLVRVFSFLMLGIALAGLAWLNRWVQMRTSPPTPEQAPEPDTSQNADPLD
ncbi:MAG: DUF2339 domain-containing protein [Pelagimonas sp.]|uniref:DUF2339 domain-containing protein n=1 Tax=Pelagimonas sp. TaxID=2073170 RepID=UPI003D6BC33F